MPRATPVWTQTPICRIEDLADAVLGAGLEAVQLSRAPVTGSLVYAEHDGITYSSGQIQGRVTLTGTLSERMVTLGIVLRIGPGSRHWLTDVDAGEFGVFLPGDDHDALYTSGSLYAAVTLSAERLEQAAAASGLVLDARALGGTGLHPRRAAEHEFAVLRESYEKIHAGGPAGAPGVDRLGWALLDAAIGHLGRPPRPVIGRPHQSGHARILARARAYVHEHLDAPIAIDALAAAAFTSRRTLYRAFADLLDETPQSYVRKLRLHRIRHDLASDAEVACTVAMAANRWGIGELGRLAGWYRELFGELPSETLARCRETVEVA